MIFKHTFRGLRIDHVEVDDLEVEQVMVRRKQWVDQVKICPFEAIFCWFFIDLEALDQQMWDRSEVPRPRVAMDQFKSLTGWHRFI